MNSPSIDVCGRTKTDLSRRWRWLALAALTASSAAFAAFMDPPRTPSERCDPVEYAELKDMPQEQLGVLYCGIDGLADQRSKEVYTAKLLAQGNASRAYFARQEAFERFEAACREQMKRVAGVYRQRFERAPPSCPPKP